jgi:hypothetical protein
MLMIKDRILSHSSVNDKREKSVLYSGESMLKKRRIKESHCREMSANNKRTQVSHSRKVSIYYCIAGNCIGCTRLPQSQKQCVYFSKVYCYLVWKRNF